MVLVTIWVHTRDHILYLHILLFTCTFSCQGNTLKKLYNKYSLLKILKAFNRNSIPVTGYHYISYPHQNASLKYIYGTRNLIMIINYANCTVTKLLLRGYQIIKFHVKTDKYCVFSYNYSTKYHSIHHRTLQLYASSQWESTVHTHVTVSTPSH